MTPRQREALRQQTFSPMKKRDFPDRPLENRMDWTRTPLFETLVTREREKTQLNLFSLFPKKETETDVKGEERS